MDRNLRGALWALGAAFVGFIVGQFVVYVIVGIRPGDRTDLLVLAVIVALFGAVGFWWGRQQ